MVIDIVYVTISNFKIFIGVNHCNKTNRQSNNYSRLFESDENGEIYLQTTGQSLGLY